MEEDVPPAPPNAFRMSDIYIDGMGHTGDDGTTIFVGLLDGVVTPMCVVTFCGRVFETRWLVGDTKDVGCPETTKGDGDRDVVW